MWTMGAGLAQMRSGGMSRRRERLTHTDLGGASLSPVGATGLTKTRMRGSDQSPLRMRMSGVTPGGMKQMGLTMTWVGGLTVAVTEEVERNPDEVG